MLLQMLWPNASNMFSSLTVAAGVEDCTSWLQVPVARDLPLLSCTLGWMHSKTSSLEVITRLLSTATFKNGDQGATMIAACTVQEMSSLCPLPLIITLYSLAWQQLTIKILGRFKMSILTHLWRHCHLCCILYSTISIKKVSLVSKMTHWNEWSLGIYECKIQSVWQEHQASVWRNPLTTAGCEFRT